MKVSSITPANILWRPHILEYTNDFAQWVGESLEERALSEHLSTVDPFELRDMSSLRRALTGIIDRYLELFPEHQRCPAR